MKAIFFEDVKKVLYLKYILKKILTTCNLPGAFLFKAYRTSSKQIEH
jgi:hypothetical protein